MRLPLGLLYASSLLRRSPNAPNAPGAPSRLDDLDRVKMGRIPYGPIIDHCTVNGTVALTFDDGPYDYTRHVLDLLEKYEAQATFFLNGDNFGRGFINDSSTPWPDMVRDMHDAGHQVASHTWSHLDLTAANASVRQQQMGDLEDAFVQILGFYPTYFRPPYGNCDESCQGDLARMGYHVVTWDLDPSDYENDSDEGIVKSMQDINNRLVGDPANTSHLVISHDVYYHTAYNLTEYMLEIAAQRGYRVVTVGQCLGDSDRNWYRIPAS